MVGKTDAIGLLKVTKAVKEMPEYKCWDSKLHYQFEWCRTYLTNVRSSVNCGVGLNG